jgi:hypothetical protein
VTPPIVRPAVSICGGRSKHARVFASFVSTLGFCSPTPKGDCDSSRLAAEHRRTHVSSLMHAGYSNAGNQSGGGAGGGLTREFKHTEGRPLARRRHDMNF